MSIIELLIYIALAVLWLAYQFVQHVRRNKLDQRSELPPLEDRDSSHERSPGRRGDSGRGREGRAPDAVIPAKAGIQQTSLDPRLRGDDGGRSGDDGGRSGDDGGRSGDDGGRSGDDWGKRGDDWGRSGDDGGRIGDDWRGLGDDRHGRERRAPNAVIPAKAGIQQTSLDPRLRGDDGGRSGDDWGKRGDDGGKPWNDGRRRSYDRYGFSDALGEKSNRPLQPVAQALDIDFGRAPKQLVDEEFRAVTPLRAWQDRAAQSSEPPPQARARRRHTKVNVPRLRTQQDLRDAIVLSTIIGPCRADQPWN